MLKAAKLDVMGETKTMATEVLTLLLEAGMKDDDKQIQDVHAHLKGK